MSSQPDPSSASHSLDEVRQRLRRLGYLDRSVERYLLQDAMRPERPVRTVLALSLKVGLLAGIPVAVAATLVLAAMNDLFVLAPSDVLPLFLHLLPPFVFALGIGFLVLGGLLTLTLSLSHSQRIESSSVIAATATACGLLAFTAWQGRAVLGALTSGQAAAIAAIALGLAVAVARVLHGGLLTLAIRLRDRPPERPITRLAWQTAPLALALVLLVAPTLLIAGPATHVPVSLAARPDARVVLIGIDGVRADEFEGLLAGGELPALSARLADGGALLRYQREKTEPAAFWTTVATGRPGEDHGMLALDGYRPRGVRTTLVRTGWMRPYFATVGRLTGLVAYRPVLAPSRRVPALWDLASRGGVPVAVVDWWGTFPAEEVPGLMVAHGSFQLLADGSAGAVAPENEQARLVRLREELSAAAAPPPAALDAAVRERLEQAALHPDAFYYGVFEQALRDRPRLAALYLPALDIAADLSDLGSVAMANLVRWQLGQVDRLLAQIGDDVGTVVLVLDPGRRQDAEQEQLEGRVLWWQRDGCRSGQETLEPEQVAAGLLRALGMPQSAQLPQPPAACAWPRASGMVETYGPRVQPAPPADGEEYLKSLQSLGYL